MTSEPESAGPPGRKVLALLLAAIVLCVGGLLTGPARTDQVCVRCLEQRHGRSFRVGSFDLGPPKWTAENAWPAATRFTNYLPPPFDRPRAATPRDYHAALFGAPCDHQWETAARTMPFALFIQIPNEQALRPGPAHLVDARRIASAVLAPDDMADRECFQRFDEVLKARKPGEEAARRRRPEVQPGEEAAEAFLRQFASVRENAQAAVEVREAVCSVSIPAVPE